MNNAQNNQAYGNFVLKTVSGRSSSNALELFKNCDKRITNKLITQFKDSENWKLAGYEIT